MLKKLERIIPPPPPHMVGDGFRVHNFFPSSGIQNKQRMSPFFMLDYASPYNFPPSDDICYATQNRQVAIKEIAPQADLVLVVGSKSSSNSQRLVEVAKRFGCKESILMHSDQELPVDKIKNSKNIGITSGASAPEILVENLIREIKQGGVGSIMGSRFLKIRN